MIGQATVERMMHMKKRYAQLAAMALCFSFLLGIKNGKVVLWQDGRSEPIKTYPYPLSMLPKEARDALSKGIPLESEEQLYEMVKDYLP